MRNNNINRIGRVRALVTDTKQFFFLSFDASKNKNSEREKGAITKMLELIVS